MADFVQTRIERYLRLASLSLAALALLYVLFVPFAAFFPASVLNDSLLERAVGVPIQVFLSIFGVLTAIFVGVSLVFKEIERRTVYTLLANPVRRWQFLCGKFLGLFTVLAMNVALEPVIGLNWWSRTCGGRAPAASR